MNSILQNAHKYAQKGWRLFPAEYDPHKRAHIGRVKWSQDSSSDLDTISDWAEKFPKAYFCVDLDRSGLTVIDVDVKEGKQGDLALFDLEMAKGLLPETLQSRTPSGGRHYFFKGVTPQTVGKLGSGLDTPGMVPIPGSTVPGKGEYLLVADKPAAVLPGWIIDLLGRPKEKSSKTRKPVVDEDQPHNILAAIDYAQSAPIAVAGRQGNQQTYQTACGIRDFAVSKEKCFWIMGRIYNPRCLPAWDPEELEDIVGHAYAYARNRAGENLAEADFPAKDRIPKRRARDIVYTEIAHQRWIIEDRYARGFVTGTIAPGGVGKSAYTLWEAAAVLCGKPLTGLKIACQGNVWLYNIEDPYNELDRRLAGCDLSNGVDWQTPMENLFYTSGQDEPLIIARDNHGLRAKDRVQINERLMENLIYDIKRNNIVLWIVDPIINAHTLNENDNPGIAALMGVFNRIATITDCAISVVHHTRKSNNSHLDAESARGATSFMNSLALAHVLREMAADEARARRVADEEKNRYICLESVKANIATPLPPATLWARKESILLPNGDPRPVVALKAVNFNDFSFHREDVASAVLDILDSETDISVYKLAEELLARYSFLFDFKSMTRMRNFITEFFQQPVLCRFRGENAQLKYMEEDHRRRGRHRIYLEFSAPVKSKTKALMTATADEI